MENTGFFAKSQRTYSLAQSLLSRYPNVWLEGWAESTLLALAIVQCDIPAALEHGRRALALGRESGATSVIRSALANMGRLHYLTGDFGVALDYLDQALHASGPNSEQSEGIRDSIARVFMAQGRIVESERLLTDVHISSRSYSHEQRLCSSAHPSYEGRGAYLRRQNARGTGLLC